jgi:hypothetical protein
MPRKDGTGPDGQGSKTGRQLGNCDGVKKPKSNGKDKGRGRNFGGWKVVDNQRQT